MQLLKIYINIIAIAPLKIKHLLTFYSLTLRHLFKQVGNCVCCILRFTQDFIAVRPYIALRAPRQNFAHFLKQVHKPPHAFNKCFTFPCLLVGIKGCPSLLNTYTIHTGTPFCEPNHIMPLHKCNGCAYPQTVTVYGIRLQLDNDKKAFVYVSQGCSYSDPT